MINTSDRIKDKVQCIAAYHVYSIDWLRNVSLFVLHGSVHVVIPLLTRTGSIIAACFFIK